MNDSKETLSSRYDSTEEHMNSQNLQHHRFKSDGIPALREGRGQELPFLTKKLSPIEIHCKGKICFSTRVSLGVQTVLNGRPHA